MILVGRSSLIIVQIKTPKHESIPSSLLESSEPYRRCSHCVCKTIVFGNEELCPFLETPKLILTFIQTIDIGLKQRLMKKLKQNALYHKINILAEKAHMIFYAFLNHFSIHVIGDGKNIKE